jgi:hypothetical protein
MLGFLYRATSGQAGIAGVGPVSGVSGIENFDFTDMIKSHDRYRYLTGKILQRLGFTDLDSEAVIQQEEMLKEKEMQRIKNKRSASTGTLDAEKELAREDGNGDILFLDGKKAKASTMTSFVRQDSAGKTPAPSTSYQNDLPNEDEYEEEATGPIRMVDNDEPLVLLDPQAEPDHGPDRETIRFGSDIRGFDIRWDRTSP